MKITLQTARLITLMMLSIGFNNCTRHETEDSRISSEGTKTSVPEKIKAEVVMTPKLYLEHSGSMFAYDNPSTKGEFKNTLLTILNGFNDLQPPSSKIYIVNDGIYSYSKNFRQLVQSDNIFNKKIGNNSYTDFERIFKSILNDTKKGEISILFSDLIYSETNNQNSNSNRILDNAQQLTHRAFAGKSAQFSILIIKLLSDYNGQYYPFNSPNQGLKYSGSRPYYVCFIADNETMLSFLTKEKYKVVSNFTKLPRYQNHILFSSGRFGAHPYYSISEGDPLNKGRFSPSRSRASSAVTSIDNVTPPRTGSLTLAVAVSMPNGIFDQKYVANPDNYDVISMKDRFKIKYIKKLDTPNTDGTTHKIILEAQNPTSGSRDVIIKLKNNRTPSWVVDTHSSDDRNTASKNFHNQTFGLFNILTGISEVYEINDTNNKYTFNLKLSLN